MMQTLFISSTGTDLGKTLVTTALCWQLRNQGKKITALKPVASGFNPKDESSDPALILKSCGLTPTPSMVQSISPWRFAAPLAPSMAAAREGKNIALDEVVAFCRDHTVLKSDAVLVEGAGGVMAPLNEQHTMLDWMSLLEWPVILVAGSYLGSLSHTLTAIEALKRRRLSLRALVVCQPQITGPALDDTAQELQKFVASDIPVVKIPHLAVKEERWKHVPPISWIVNG